MPEQPKWDETKLDALLTETFQSFCAHLKDDEQFNRLHPCGEDEERDTHSTVGYFMYELLACKPGENLPEIERIIEGPLFGGNHA